MNEKVVFLKERFKENLLVADLQYSLFMSALSSYKHDTVLRPFPPTYVDEGPNDVQTDKRNFKKLGKDAEKTPEFRKLQCYDFSIGSASSSVIDILHWCLSRPGYTLKPCQKNKFSVIKELTKQQTPTTSPHYIFEVVYNDENERKFEDRRDNKNILYGYHGSSIENFHSILNYGLQSHRSKNALFGEGTYLSSELAISLQYSPHGHGWEHSILGDRLSCIAVCEMIDNPSWVKCQVKETTKDLKRIGSRAKIAGSEGGEIPETYYVVRNNDAIRVKYLLLYVDRTRRKSHSWFVQHKFAVYVGLYGILLLLIALYSSKSFWKLVKRHTSAFAR